MRSTPAVVVLTAALACAASVETVAADAATLATVRIPVAVLAGGRTLPAGIYDLRLTDEHPTPEPGQPAGARRYVELLADGTVVARDAVEVLLDTDRTTVGASSAIDRAGVRVDRLRTDDLLRVSVKRPGERFLLYLPLAGQGS